MAFEAMTGVPDIGTRVEIERDGKWTKVYIHYVGKYMVIVSESVEREKQFPVYRDQIRHIKKKKS